MSFEKDLARFVEKAEHASEETIRAASMEMFADIIARTPVGNIDLWENVKEWRQVEGNSGRPPWLEGYIGGTARGNWQTAVGSRPGGELPRRSPELAKGEALLATANFTLADTIYFANNLPYIRRLEEGTSTQAPRGMVGVTLDSFREKINSNARKYRI